ncbi:hypothetical protein MMC21_003350 [Puttea exsequens]|nr:hypothetical protein [Puttea exsequens]
MATSLTLRRGSRQVNEKLDTRKIVGTAIAENDVESIKSLLLERDKTFLRYRHWAEFFAEDVEALDEVSQEEFRSTLMKIAGDKLCAYLRSALQSSDDEQVALLILNRRPDLFVKRLDDELPFNMAASNGQAKVLVRFLEYIKTTGQQHLLFPSIVTDGYTEPLEQKSRQPTTVLERATERGYLDIVKSLVVFDSRLLDRGYPLHKAVRGGHLDVVEYLLEKKSDLVERFMPGSYRSVLFEERTKGQDDESSKEIDRLLVAHIIRGGSSNKSPSMIKKLLRGPRGAKTLKIS